MRIIFTDRDLARTRLAEYPNPLAEAVLSVRVLRHRVMSWLDPWRSATRARLTPQMRPLLDLVPRDGWVPDFLGGTWSSRSLPEALDRLRETSEQAVDADLARIAAEGRPVAGRFAAAGVQALGKLAEAVAAYHQVAIAPQRTRLTTAFDADRASRARILADGGIDLLLATLHPAIQWNPPVLELTRPASSLWGDEEIRLDGGGLLIYPAVTGFRPESASIPGQRTAVLINPIANPRAIGPASSTVPAGLTALLGPARAGALRALTHAGGCTTTELARHLGITPTTASHHAAILRNAGLITTQRHHNTVLHTLTPLGIAVIDANTPHRTGNRRARPPPSLRPCSSRPARRPAHTIPPSSPCLGSRLADLRSHRRGHHRLGRRARLPHAACSSGRLIARSPRTRRCRGSTSSGPPPAGRTGPPGGRRHGRGGRRAG